MRIESTQYRQTCEAQVFNLFESTGRVFFTRDQIAKQTGIGGRALDRVLSQLTSTKNFARFHLVEEYGELSPQCVIGALPLAFSFRRLNYVLQPDGSYLLGESSSDDVSCYCSQQDYLMRNEVQQQASTFDPITFALFPKLARIMSSLAS